jgi:hypothetical protein
MLSLSQSGDAMATMARIVSDDPPSMRRLRPGLPQAGAIAVCDRESPVARSLIWWLMRGTPPFPSDQWMNELMNGKKSV